MKLDFNDKSAYIDDYITRTRAEMKAEGRHGPVVQDGTGGYGVNEEQSARGRHIYPFWPYLNTTGWWEDSFVYLYEFMRGSRLASTNQLQLCETPVRSYIESA